jgi:hypothetical protein
MASVSSSEEARQLGSLLLALTQPDTNTIRQAEQALKPLLKDSRSVPALVEILKGRDEYVSSEYKERMPLYSLKEL